MNLKLTIWLNFLLISFHRTVIIAARRYAFLVDDPTIFEDCKDESGYLGVADMLDLSNLKLEFQDDIVHMEGSVTMQWDADPNDRVELRADIFKYERGSWQPTVFTLIQKDFCRSLFNEEDLLYKTWAKYINGDDLKCITNKGHTYHHEPFDLETVFESEAENMSGRHKVVFIFDAYNQYNQKQPYSVCVEVVGDIVQK